MIGISRAYLAQIEGGERTGTLEVMARVARALDRRLEDLIAPGPDNFAQAAASLGAMPAKLKEIAAAIAEGAWRSKPAGGGFSLVEHVCHLRDIDGDGYRVRLERMLTEQRAHPCPTSTAMRWPGSARYQGAGPAHRSRRLRRDAPRDRRAPCQGLRRTSAGEPGSWRGRRRSPSKGWWTS